MSPTPQRHTGAREAGRIALVVLALAAVVLGTWMVVTGGDDGATAAEPAGSGGAGESGPAMRLDLDDTSMQGVRDLSGLAVPDSAQDFLTARLEDGTQLDITFTLDPAEEAAFVAGSGLPAPAEGLRVITHSSPMWKLNPEGEIRGAGDTVDGVRRSVELVEEDGRTRVRAVILPTG
jgi:hypothetical protein